ncbi:hypothetical protein [Glaciimonas soli]|uniref:Uncharacterized protein n=1 Tax=Glaciimonas soli TaxID=2590999 RepID=A0A843YR93_9BURK|nr:hypothetical protein [Glaciimonas soli]MQQ99245.1 hypothetical protein [Glaciimonas soli]
MIALLPELIAFLVELVAAAGAVIARARAYAWALYIIDKLWWLFKNEIKNWLKKDSKKIIAYAISSLVGIDLEVNDDGEFVITEKSITQAINKELGTSFNNVFDRDALKNDLEKIGIGQLNHALGAPPDKPIITGLNDQDVLRQRMHGYVAEQVKIAMEGGASTLIDASARQRIITAAMAFEANYDKLKPQEKQPLIMTTAAIKNRERQARYRAKHKRMWVEK